MNNHPEKKSSAIDLGMKVSKVSIIVNTLLSVLKLAAGIFAHSSAMISDAIHSFSDVGSTLIVIAGINIANKKSDKNHPYGHERFESIASMILVLALLITGLGIGYSGLATIISGKYNSLVMPGMLALIAAIISIAVKEWMFHYTIKAADQINSGALKADAWHHRSDALSSIGALIGIIGSRLGLAILDPLASIVICIFIIKAAYDIGKDAIDRIVDKACDDETVEKIRNIIMDQDGVEKIDLLKTRLFGSKIYVDLEISVDGELKLKDAHDIAERVHDAIEYNIPEVKHCMVHVNPR